MRKINNLKLSASIIPRNRNPKEADNPTVKASPLPSAEFLLKLTVGASEGLEEGACTCWTTGAKKPRTLAVPMASLKSGVCSSVAL